MFHYCCGISASHTLFFLIHWTISDITMSVLYNPIVAIWYTYLVYNMIGLNKYMYMYLLMPIVIPVLIGNLDMNDASFRIPLLSIPITIMYQLFS